MAGGDDGREIEFVLVDHELSPSQARNLEVKWAAR